MRWLRDFLFRSRRYADLEVSIKEHLEEEIEVLMEDGMSRKDAELSARREFGNVTLMNERSREIWQWSMLESIWADMKFALRQLVKAPGFTATAVITLALGIAVNASMFSLVSAFLLARPPGRNPQNIVVVTSVNPNGGERADTSAVSAPNYLAWRKATNVFAEMAAADDYRTASLVGQGQPKTVRYAAVSTNYFKLFGVSPKLGRTFSEQEEQPGRARVAILSQALWEGRFGSDRSIVGRTIRLNREDYVVIGVMPAEFRLLGFISQLWTPLVLSAADQTAVARKDRSLTVFARLAPGVTLKSARAELILSAKRAEAESPTIERHWGAAVRTLPDFLVHNFAIRSALVVLMTTVSFILIIACANVAGLLLTRATGRQKELAIRISIGAGRARILRQLLTEGLVIALLGGSAGLLLTYVGVNLVRANLQFNEAISAVTLTLDSTVLMFVLGVSLVSAALSSVVPALKSTRSDVNTDLKSESRTASSGRSQSRLRAALVSVEIALAVFLLTGTSLLIRGIFLLDHQALGFHTDHLLTASLALDHAKYGDENRQLLFVDDLLTRLQRLPGVEEAAVASDLPATGAAGVSVAVLGEPERPASEQRSALDVTVTNDYFQTIGIPVLRGRVFSEVDNANGSRVTVVNQEFVRRYLEDKNPVGVQIKLEVKGATPVWSSIVGVVSNVKTHSEETRVDPEVYEAYSQRCVPTFSVLLRTREEPNGLITALREAVSEIDSELPLAQVMSMDSVIAQQRNGNPLFEHLLGTFACLALILAAIGIYGLAAYSVGQRTQEIGIRMALGAKARDILRMILREGFRTASIGAALGLAIALPLPRLFDSIFQGIRFGAPAIHVAVLGAILMVAAFAIFIPALRATQVDPRIVLRNQ